MEDFVPFKLAQKLKEKGFKEECLCHYVGEDLYYNIESPIANNQLWFSHNKFDNIWHRDNHDAPTISQVLKWLRNTHKLFISPCVITDYQDDFHRDTTYWSFIVVNIESGDSIYREYERVTEKRYESYEQAAIAGVNYCLDNLI